MVRVSPPPFDAMGGLGDALMGVMRETAVSSSTILTVITFCSLYSSLAAITQHYLLNFVQFLVKVELSSAAMVSVSSPLAAVMGIKIALMAVTKLDVVSYQIIHNHIP